MLFICEYYSILYVFRLKPSTVVQETYDVCVNIRIHSSAWFQAWFIASYIQTTESRNSVVEGTAQGNYLRGWGLSVVKGKGAAQCRIYPPMTKLPDLTVLANQGLFKCNDNILRYINSNRGRWGPFYFCISLSIYLTLLFCQILVFVQHFCSLL